MSFLEDPIKTKRAFIITLILSIIFLLGCGVLGYFYYRNNNRISELENLLEDSKNLQEKYNSLEEEKNNLEEENKSLKEDKSSLESQVNDYKTKQDGIKAYNEFLKYMTSVIETHGGFSGWTESEYQHARSLAQATGNSQFISHVDWAWHQTSIDPVTRLLVIYKDIIAGIEESY